MELPEQSSNSKFWNGSRTCDVDGCRRRIISADKNFPLTLSARTKTKRYKMIDHIGHTHGMISRWTAPTPAPKKQRCCYVRMYVNIIFIHTEWCQAKRRPKKTTNIHWKTQQSLATPIWIYKKSEYLPMWQQIQHSTIKSRSSRSTPRYNDDSIIIIIKIWQQHRYAQCHQRNGHSPKKIQTLLLVTLPMVLQVTLFWRTVHLNNATTRTAQGLFVKPPCIQA